MCKKIEIYINMSQDHGVSKCPFASHECKEVKEEVVESTEVAVEDKKKQETPVSLYEKYGGDVAVQKIVCNFYEEHIFKDPSLAHYFKDFKPGQMQKKMSPFLSEALGSKIPYKGKSMHDAHRGMKITNEDFDTVARHLISAITNAGVDPTDIEVIKNHVLSYRGDIVEA